jgi:ribosome-associated protein
VALPAEVRTRLYTIAGKRINTQDELVITAHRFRTQTRNRQDAIDRLLELIRKAATPIKARKKTKPSQQSKQRRLENKKHRAKVKSLRGSKLKNEI